MKRVPSVYGEDDRDPKIQNESFLFLVRIPHNTETLLYFVFVFSIKNIKLIELVYLKWPHVDFMVMFDICFVLFSDNMIAESLLHLGLGSRFEPKTKKIIRAFQTSLRSLL